VNVDFNSMNFNTLWKQYEKELTNFVRARLFDKSLASDIMQEVAIKIFKNQDNFSNIENIRAWLYRITRNTLIDFYKQNDKNIPDELYSLDLIGNIHENQNKDLETCITSISSNLKESDNDILNLSIIEQYSIIEIATKLGLSSEGVKSKLKRAKKKVAQKFFSCCNLEEDIQGKILDFKQNNNKSCNC